MKEKLRHLNNWFKRIIKAVTPGKNAMKGAAYGALVFTALCWILFAMLMTINIRDGWILLICLLIVVATTLLAIISRWLINQLDGLPKLFRLSLFISIPLLLLVTTDWRIMITFIFLAMLFGASILVLRKTGFNNLTTPRKVITIVGLLVGFGGFIPLVYAYVQDGFELDPIKNAALSTDNGIPPINAPSPAAQGSYEVLTLTYGSGKDIRRTEFGEEVNIRTDSVNGVPFIDNWDGLSGWWRKRYWGFDAWSLPLNGRVWYPDGEGPFPLVLVVHGNHGMQDFSDPGYDYLGELLASRGMILASVDENFINGSWSDLFGGSLEKENDARGWLLLEHLRIWHEWNKREGHMFEGKIDTSRLALMGHSRGGEAVSHAAMFNQLPYYPDDASVPFDYNYAIKSIVAIAPVDGQYRPGDSRTKFENVDYFVFHGSQDADVTSFMGSQQYERVKFTDSLYHFKSALYIYGANHGQFNTSWGNNDTGMPFTGILNLKQLLTKEDQELIAKVYISAFLEASLNDKREYLPLFLDSRKGTEWLPETIYLSQFEDSSMEIIAGYDEDYDVTTITQDSGLVSTQNLTVWREEEIQLKWQQKGSRALVVGWHYQLADDQDSIDSVADSLIASYTLELPSTSLDTAALLVFSMAESSESPNPKSSGKWVQNTENNDEITEDEESDLASAEKEDEDHDEDDDEKKAKEPIDFTIRLTDTNGNELAFPLSIFSPLQRELKVVIRKMDFLTDNQQSEKVFQTFYFPLVDLQKRNPDFNLSAVVKLEFIFNKSTKGVVMIDEIGTMKARK